ncbi:MAG: hypothetical protein EOP84_13900, partial [Verrucomicrobiaceae bacterium]
MSALSRKRRKIKFVARAVPAWLAQSGAQQAEITAFDTREQAEEAMRDDVDDPCMDNYRFAYEDDPAAMQEYETISEGGCCGSYNRLVLVGGRRAWIGCN